MLTPATPWSEPPGGGADTPSGVVFDIQRMCVHDGPGIRTVVFLKGCPLRCAWCHNPEGMDPRPQLLYHAAACVQCGKCAEVCPEGAHLFDSETGHLLDRSRCRACFACVDACCAGALTRAGRTMTVAEVMAEALRDKPFYDATGGGITLSGGEPLAQPEFARALLAAARGAGVHTCVETSCAVPWAVLQGVLPVTDLFLADLKETDPALHKHHTGRGNRRILANLRALDRAGAALVLRCPLVPGATLRDDHLAAVAALVKSLNRPPEVHIMAYHPGGLAKREKIGGAPPSPPPPGKPMNWQEAEAAAERLRRLGVGRVRAV
ncbi:MAG: glycyl-radical enzyme activating protein [Candidatus Hydrogenedentes bacterium]|nr:glycyl-radical enzyme activating protein [Candidatus Hydrogenedentota bacterium]